MRPTDLNNKYLFISPSTLDSVDWSKKTVSSSDAPDTTFPAQNNLFTVKFKFKANYTDQFSLPVTCTALSIWSVATTSIFIFTACHRPGPNHEPSIHWQNVTIESWLSTVSSNPPVLQWGVGMPTIDNKQGGMFFKQTGSLWASRCLAQHPYDCWRSDMDSDRHVSMLVARTSSVASYLTPDFIWGAPHIIL